MTSPTIIRLADKITAESRTTRHYSRFRWRMDTLRAHVPTALLWGFLCVGAVAVGLTLGLAFVAFVESWS